MTCESSFWKFAWIKSFSTTSIKEQRHLKASLYQGDRANYQSRIILCDSAWKRLDLPHMPDACAKLGDKVKEKNMESFARVILHEMM